MPDSVLLCLNQLETSLKKCNCWQMSEPSAAALASSQPFCVDTLSLPQWLQFILIPRMHALIESGSQLPQKVDIYPYAEESVKQLDIDTGELLTSIKAFDECFPQ
ncbi:YqcC family protein [Agarivorans sp. 1_MG-2023]|uniref:YqcC family protein n=1 Tax=Agarivorans sp. 1_MG-2023 TaxID=3062634 RepID=UPI0026E2A0F9|nr:YqcC family protein [Agarivorans sp. 1_MG-2023]MDO6765035.1 YqcC family protein [Agarivorans sp. 1_MG-2023]